MPAIAICILGHAVLTTAPNRGWAAIGFGVLVLGVLMAFWGY